MSLKLGDVFPDFTADTSGGRIDSFHAWMSNRYCCDVPRSSPALLRSSWTIFFSHPADFTPVCTTELARAVQLQAEFEKRGVKMIAISCDNVDSHQRWSEDVMHYSRVMKTKYAGGMTHDMHPPLRPYPTDGDSCSAKQLPFPIIDDEKRELAIKLGMIDPEE